MATPPVPAKTPTRDRAGGTHLFLPREWDQRRYVKWIQGTHAWLGFAASAAILMFAVSGFVLDHNKHLRLKMARTDTAKAKLEVPEAARGDVQAFTTWLGGALELTHRLNTKVIEPRAAADWNGEKVPQPRRYQVSYTAPHEALKVEYVVGNTFASVERRSGNLFQIMNQLHLMNGVGVGWLLFSDFAALTLVMLSLTGVLLWSKLHGRRLLAIGLAGGSVFVTLLIVLRTMYPG